MTDAPRSYIVTTPDGSTYRRNRRHINKDYSKSNSYLSDVDDDPSLAETELHDNGADDQTESADPNFSGHSSI